MGFCSGLQIDNKLLSSIKMFRQKSDQFFPGKYVELRYSETFEILTKNSFLSSKCHKLEKIDTACFSQSQYIENQNQTKYFLWFFRNVF